MPTPISVPSSADAASGGAFGASAPAIKTRPLSATWSSWLREPLLHFALLGGLLFAVDHALVGRSDDPHTIIVGAEVDCEAKALFKASRGREPTAAELKALRERWVDNEVLYREGLALQVDRGDTAIRERVIFKALSVVDANTQLPALVDARLRDWFERHRDKYDEPARYDFQEAVLSGDNSEPAVRSFVDALKAGTPGDAQAGLRVFKGRPHANLLESYGAEFAKTLEESAPGEWRAVRAREGSKEGAKEVWRAVRLEAVTPARPAAFEALRSVVQQDWTDAVMAEQRTAAVRALGLKYKVKLGEAGR